MDTWQERRKKALKNKTIKRWIEHPRSKPTEPPLVMQGEAYFKRGARHKLHIGQPVMHALEEAGLCTYQNGSQTYKEHHPLTAHSVAQSISIGWNVDPKNVLLPHARRPKETTIPQHIATLCNAYEGTMWFDRFRRFYEVHAKKAGLPVVREWQIIPRSSLDSWLCIDNQNQGMRLCEKGVIARRDGKSFTAYSSESIIHNEGFAMLLAYLNNTSLDKIFLPAHQEPFYQELIARLAEQHVIPKLVKAHLHPGYEYTCPHAAKLLGYPVEHLKKARLDGRLPYIETKDPQWPRIKGIDIVLFSMRPPRRYTYTLQQLAETFRMPLVDVPHLRLPLSKAGNYGHQQSVLPLWEIIRDSVRKTFLDTPAAIDSRQAYFTGWMKNASKTYQCAQEEVGFECTIGTQP